MKKKWEICKKVGEDEIKKFTDLNPWVLQLLFNRGITDRVIMEKFLEPSYESLSSPFLLSGMSDAVRRILNAKVLGEKITIYADYDADAVTAATVLFRALKQLGAENLDCYIPDRFAEGYGLNSAAMEKIAQNGTKLIITVDCGINAVEEVAIANGLGADVIVTDHHEIAGELPPAVAVVNQKRDDLPDLAGLTGVGVAFKLVQALFFALYPEHYPLWSPPETISDAERKEWREKFKKTPVQWEKWLLDLVALGTVADCQSVLGENRILVKFGLKVLSKTRCVGLRQMIRNAGLDERVAFDTFDLGFILAPRINAAGRIQHADIAFRLLTTEDPSEAATLAGQLESLNSHRQRLTEQIFSEAKAQAELQHDNKILLAVGKDWPKGVVGLVASKLSEEFWRPAVVLERGEEVATGSARSVGKFNIFEAFFAGREHLVRFGGHAQAAGLTIVNERIEVFHQHLLAFAAENLREEDLVRQERIDAVIELAALDLRLVDILSKFEPFGPGNPAPRFLVKNLRVETIAPVGQTGKHVRIAVSSAGKSYRLIGFGKSYLLRTLAAGEVVDVILEPSENVWNGQTNVQLKIIDLVKNLA
jgi:single-stranded-DNA-specific exonuclease